MNINSSIILRRDGDMFLLFNPGDGTLTRINTVGAVIWQCLQHGFSEAEIIEKLNASSSVSREQIASDVHVFLGMLAKKHYLAGFDGVEVPAVKAKAPVLNDRPLYEMSSMLRVFTPGDALVLEDIAFGDFQIGDIVTFYPNGVNFPGIVHRVIARNTASLTTMGDNNPAVDTHPVTVADFPRLVTAKIRPDGKRFAVKRGGAGLCQFRINRMHRFLRRIGGKVLNPLLPLMFWRKTLHDSVQFGNIMQYYYKRRMVAKSDKNGIEFVPAWNKLRFRLPKEK